MICRKCPAKATCETYREDPDREAQEKHCCFAEPDRPYAEVCKKCDCLEQCRIASGCGHDTIIVMEET